MLNSLPLIKLPNSLSNTLVNNAPLFLKPVIKLVPIKFQQSLLLSALNSVFEESIKDGDFEFLQNKWLKISVIDLDLHWLLSYQDNNLIMASSNLITNEAVSFSATGDDLILIAGRKEDPDTLFFQRRLKIEGDTELGLEVKNLIDAIDLEHLPTLVHKAVDLLANLIKTNK